MSKIVGTYVNQTLNAKLTILTANDSDGAITGTLNLGSTQLAISGVWNASTVAPNGIFGFTGSVLTPNGTEVVGGAAQTDDFNLFNSLSLGFAVAQKGTETMNLSGKFARV